MNPRDWRRRLPSTPVIVVAIAALALLARLLFLDARIAHWDEGRVGFDVLRYMATGAWEYRPIVHGPFLAHVNRVVFSLLGPSDFSMRLIVAVVGGLFPLSAWLFRDHLRDVEVVALALFFAVDPVLVYYSRFMRNDVLVAAFAVTALGFYVRLHATREHRYLYAGTFFLALSFTAKENAILYPITVLGGLVLLLDHRLFLARFRDGDWTGVLQAHVERTVSGLWTLRLPLAVAAVEFFAIFVFFYAPREAAVGGLGLWQSIANPTQLPDLVAAATYNPAPCDVPAGETAARYCDGALEKAFDSWFAGGHQDHPYLPYLAHDLKVLAVASGGLALLSVVGFLADRYAGDRPGDLAALGFYWGVVSLLGYPLATDIQAPWLMANAVVALAFPAAAGVALFVDWGVEGLEREDAVSVALSAVVLLLLVGQLPVMAVQTSYVAPQREGNVLIQYAQPEGDMRPALEDVERAARANDGVDVVWYGDDVVMADEGSADRLPAGGNWYARLPMPWYLERFGAVRDSTDDPNELYRMIQEDRPPVVLVLERDQNEIHRDMTGYVNRSYESRQWAETLVFYVDEEYVTEG